VARTSAAPGKTRLANVYRVTVDGGGSGKWSLYFVDLPGYGYARGGADAAAELGAVAEAYFAAADGVSGTRPMNDRRAGIPADTPARVRRGDGERPAHESTAKAGGGAASIANREHPDREARLVTAALLLVDSRHPGLDSDVQAARWLSAMRVEYRIVATKIDKLSRSERARNLNALEITVGMPPLPVSAASGEGMDALWKTIASLARSGRE
jgi:GTP-binding protein